MAQTNSPVAAITDATKATLPTVLLEVRPTNGRSTTYEVGDGGFLIGGVPGCDLRLPGANLAPLVCLISRHAHGASLRKLAPVQGLAVNGRPVNSTYLNDGDRVAIAGVEIAVAISRAAVVEPPPPVEQPSESASTQEHAELLELRKELANIRQQLYHRYHERRDKLHAKDKALRKAAAKLIARKRDLDAKTGQINKSQQEWSLREAEIEARTEQVQRERKLLEEQAHEFTARQQELQRALAERVQDVQTRERRLAEGKAALEKSHKEHQSDLVRLDRIQAKTEQQRKQLQSSALTVDRRFEQLQRDSRELEEQAQQLDEWHQRLTVDAERLAQQKREQDAASAQINQRAAALEGQQAMLAALRTRLERTREDVRRQEQALNDQRVLHEAGQTDLLQKTEEVRKLREALDIDKQMFDEEHRRVQEERATLAAAVAQLRQARDTLATEEKALRERQQYLDATSAEQAEQASLLLARGSQMDELHKRLKTERETLQIHEEALGKAEATVAALQEQLRRRAEELNDGQRQLTEREEKLAQEQAAFESRRQGLVQEQTQSAGQIETLRLDLLAREADLARQVQNHADKESALRAEMAQLEVASRELATQRERLSNDRLGLDVERQAASDLATRMSAEFERIRAEALQLQREAPELEAHTTAALERLTAGREQLREHLAEIHAYARQSRDDLEAARRHVQSEAERIRQQELALHVARDEHRLAVAGFRQQLIEWQGLVAEMKQTLVRGESQLERRQAEVHAQERQIASTSARLLQQAEELEHKEQQVAQRRDVMEGHLADMREWYRRKLRELAGVDRPPDGDASSATGDDEADVVRLPVVSSVENEPQTLDEARPAAEMQSAERGILSLTAEVDPGDRQLGDLLRSHDLMDADTLTTLLLEARRQRRSLRQLLLAGNYLTLYQMALIEASNLDALMLGPVRVVDRLPSTPREALFRVFDPRHNREALLRHLAEAEMEDAVRPDEFRQRFAAAVSVQHVHVAATYEVLEINGRPAVLQEWLKGVPSTEWTALAAAPGVWFRLLGQAALALRTAHDSGLVHGRLRAESFVFTTEGVLKLCGLGEPAWLSAATPEETEPTPAADLGALGWIAAGWTTLTATGKAGKTKGFPDVLLTILQRLTTANDVERFPNAAVLLDELDRVSGEIPANAAAWQRFIGFAREQAGDAALRASA